MLGCGRLADSIHRRRAAQTPCVGHVAEKLAISEDHLWHYSIRIHDIVKPLEFVCMIMVQIPGSLLAPNPFPPPFALQQASARAIPRSSCCPALSAPIRSFPPLPAVNRTSVSSLI